MKVVRRYLLREISSGVVFVLLGFLALFAFFDLVSELDDIGRGGYRIQHAMGYVALSLPGRAYELMPVAALIGSIYALAQFASHSEFTAMRAAGMGRSEALKAVLAASVSFVVFTAVIGELISPPAERLAQSLRLGSIGGSLGGQFRSGIWIKDTVRDGSGAPDALRFVNIRNMESDSSLRGVRIFEFTPDFTLRSVLHADSARFEKTKGWRLQDVQETRFEVGRTADGLATLNAKLVKEGIRHWASEIGPDILRVSMVVPARMSLPGLIQYVRHLKENRQSAERYEIALWKKIVYPLAVVVMMVLALPFGYMQVRGGSIGYKVFAGIMLGVIFHFMNGLFSNLGLLNTWPAWLAVSLPSLVALVVALFMLARVGQMR
jgi:lipopolysaccharide export system permease protein